MVSNRVEPYTAYYTSQAGNGMGTIYRGSVTQKGRGIGSFLSGLFRSVLPILRRGAHTVGREALRTGAHILGDIAENKPIGPSVRSRISNAGDNLKRKAEHKIEAMAGAGFKPPKHRKPAQSSGAVQRRNTVRKLKKKRVPKHKDADIFSVNNNGVSTQSFQ